MVEDFACAGFPSSRSGSGTGRVSVSPFNGAGCGNLHVLVPNLWPIGPSNSHNVPVCQAADAEYATQVVEGQTTDTYACCTAAFCQTCMQQMCSYFLDSVAVRRFCCWQQRVADSKPISHLSSGSLICEVHAHSRVYTELPSCPAHQLHRTLHFGAFVCLRHPV